jgi:hypothetical protein
MNTTRKSNLNYLCDQLTVDTESLQALLGCGKKTAIEIGKLAEAKITMGRRVLWNVSKISKYLDSIATE